MTSTPAGLACRERELSGKEGTSNFKAISPNSSEQRRDWSPAMNGTGTGSGKTQSYLLPSCCGIGLLERPASESGRLRHGDGGHEWRARRRRAFMLLDMWNGRRSRRQLAQRQESRRLGAKLAPNVGGPSPIILRCRHAEGSPVCSVGFS